MSIIKANAVTSIKTPDKQVGTVRADQSAIIKTININN